MQLFDEEDLLAILNEQVQCAGGQTAWAKKFGIMPSDVNNALHRRRSVSKAMLVALGVKMVVRYAYEENCTAVPIDRAARQRSPWANAGDERSATQGSGSLPQQNGRS
jgi:hypothetical protein